MPEEKSDGKFMDLFEVDAGDRHTGREFIELKKLLPKSIQRPIPICIVDDMGEWNYEVIALMSLVRAKRELPGLNKDAENRLMTDIRNKLNANNVRAIAKELVYFWGDSTREEIEERMRRPTEAIPVPESTLG